MLKHISRFASKRPLGVVNRKLGGRSGYAGGRTIFPWYTPSLYTELGGPRNVKCHSNRSASNGSAV